MAKLNGQDIEKPRPLSAPEIDVDLLESFVDQWDSTIRKANILGKDVAVDPGMQNLIDAGREYARLVRDSEETNDADTD